jgi:uncharacterized protein (DUF1499 family)
MNTVKSKQISSYIVIAIVLVITFILWNSHVFAGQSPINIGVNNGKLTACPTTPNCVNSQASASDIEHTIAPIKLNEDTPKMMANVKQVIQAMPRTSIVKEANNYLYVEFASKLIGFVDDVEFYLDDMSKTIQVRSASRLGESDLGVNRQRIEEIRSRLSSIQGSQN